MLMVATAGARGRGLEAMRILLRRGASVYLQDANDGTALMSTPLKKQASFAVFVEFSFVNTDG